MVPSFMNPWFLNSGFPMPRAYTGSIPSIVKYESMLLPGLQNIGSYRFGPCPDILVISLPTEGK